MFGHPKGLNTLFFTELWERLSYYGMRAILVLFMVASWKLAVGDLRDSDSFVNTLRTSPDNVSQFIRSQFTDETLTLLNDASISGEDFEQLRASIIQELNSMIEGDSLFTEERFAEVELSDETRELIAENPTGERLEELNRRLLEETYPGEINRRNQTGFGMDAETAGAIYGIYTALVYLVALPGGWIADRILGMRRSVFLGGCIITAGHFSMAVPGMITFFLGLLLIVVGTGLLKPNISALVGELYPEGGARRDAGFSVYYMGINIGAFLGPLICGYLGQKIDWHLGFSAAGIGMVFGLIQYKLGEKSLAETRSHALQDPGVRAAATRQLMTGLGGILGFGVVAFLVIKLFSIDFTLNDFAQSTGVFIVLIAMAYFVWLLSSGRWTKVEKQRIGVIIVLFFASAIFWAGFEQAGSSLNLFADRMTDLNMFGYDVPSSWLQSVNPVFIILLAPVYGWLWVRLGSRQPSIPVKFALGMILLGVGFLVLAWGAANASEVNKVSPAWLIITYFFHTSGELCLSPIGLSSVTKLSPRPLVGQMMGIWFTGTALGNLIAGLLGGRFETTPPPDLFQFIFYFSAISGVILLLFSKPIKRLIGNVS